MERNAPLPPCLLGGYAPRDPRWVLGLPADLHDHHQAGLLECRIGGYIEPVHFFLLRASSLHSNMNRILSLLMVAIPQGSSTVSLVGPYCASCPNPCVVPQRRTVDATVNVVCCAPHSALPTRTQPDSTTTIFINLS